MELRRATDALLRLQVSPGATLLSPSSTTRWSAAAQLSCRRASRASIRRSITTTTRNDALPSTPTTSATAKPAHSSQPTSNQADGSPANAPNSRPSIEELTSSLWAQPKPNPSVSPLFPGSSPSSPGSIRRPGSISAISLLEGLRKRGPTTPYDSKRQLGALDIGRMMVPPSSAAISPGRDSSILRNATRTPKEVRRPLRCHPSTGRQAIVGGNTDANKALAQVNKNCMVNRVKADHYGQRYHERPGMKRKRLKRQRWRKRFMEGFKATCDRVRELNKQGW